MEVSELVLDIVQIVAIIGLAIAFIKQKRALAKHVCKLKKTLEALKENLEQQIQKAASPGEIKKEVPKKVIVGAKIRQELFGGSIKRTFGTDFFTRAKRIIDKRRKK